MVFGFQLLMCLPSKLRRMQEVEILSTQIWFSCSLLTPWFSWGDYPLFIITRFSIFWIHVMLTTLIGVMEEEFLCWVFHNFARISTRNGVWFSSWWWCPSQNSISHFRPYFPRFLFSLVFIVWVAKNSNKAFLKKNKSSRFRLFSGLRFLGVISVFKTDPVTDTPLRG